MVSAFAKYLLRKDYNPFVVAEVTKSDEKECWEYVSDLAIELRMAERAYDALEVQKQVREWVSTIPEAKAVKIAILRERLHESKKHPEKYDVKKLVLDLAILQGRVEQITPEKIERAEAYPMEQLLPFVRGKTKCIWHNEKTPSLCLKNNKVHCFGCGKNGNTIHVYRELHNCSFIEAVNFLSK